MKTSIFLFSFVFIVFFSCTNEHPSQEKKDFYSDGTLKFIKRYKNGKLDGQAQWFYPNGTIEQIVEFKDGKENGNAYYFYKSGALQNFRHWRNGNMNGYVADYYDDTVGIIKAVLLYNDNGELVYKKNFDSLGKFINEEGQKPAAP